MSSNRRLWWITGLTALVLLAAAWIPGLRPVDGLAWTVQQRLPTASRSAAERMLENLAKRGEPGIAYVVSHLEHPREPVARAARQVLRRTVQRWTMFPTDQRSQQVAALAKELSDVTPRLGSHGQQFAAELAEDLIQFPLDREQVNVARVLAEFEQILETRAPESPTVRTASDPVELYRQLTANEPLDAGPISINVPPGVGDEPPPAALPGVPDALPNSPSSPPPPASFSPQNARPLTDQSAVVEDLNSDDESIEWSAELRSLADTEVMRLIQHPQTHVAVAAVTELKRRGFRASQLRLARRLTSTEPRVRRELARELPEWTELDIRPWLIELSRDSDASVRGAAVAVMQTSNEPLIQRRLADMRGEETDEQVLQQLRQVPARRTR